MPAQLYRVILPVTDIVAARVFYAALLGTPGEMVSPGRCYFEGGGGAILACYDPVADGDRMEGGWRHHDNQYLYFSVGDLPAAHAAAERAGALEVGPIGKMPWGETLFYAKDPFGNPICFVERGTEFNGAARG
jgi:predicted enzyme related to lactoylglutathione lyase